MQAEELRSSASMLSVGEVPLAREQTALVYELELWRQSKAITELVDVRIAPPEGWAVGDIEVVVGGGTGRGMGVHGEGRELTAEVVDGAAVVSGTVTADIASRSASPIRRGLRIWTRSGGGPTVACQLTGFNRGDVLGLPAP